MTMGRAVLRRKFLAKHPRISADPLTKPKREFCKIAPIAKRRTNKIQDVHER
jgi:hypothetical protein